MASLDEVFKSVEVVLRERDKLAELYHVSVAITDFLDCICLKWTLSKAAATGSVPLMARLAAKRLQHDPWPRQELESAMEIAAQLGHIKAMDFIHQRFHDRPGSLAADAAASAGRLNALQWLQANSSIDRVTESAMDNAAANGHLEVVEWLHANSNEGCTTRAMDLAAGNGHLEVVRWLHEHRLEGCTSQAVDWAARGGHLYVLQWLHRTRRERISVSAMDAAVAHGRLETAKWLHNHLELRWTSFAVETAASNGRRGVMQWVASLEE